MAAITKVSSTETSITVRLTGLQSDYNGRPRTCQWFVDYIPWGTMELQNMITSSQSYTFSGLQPGTSYRIEAIVRAGNWPEDVSIGVVSFSTNEEATTSNASIKKVSSTATSITVRLINLQADYNGAERKCDWWCDKYLYNTMTLQNNITQSQSYSFSGLSPGTAYEIKAIIYASDWPNRITIGPTTLYTGDNAIEPFYWSTASRNAFRNGGSTTALTAREWNSLIKKVQEIYPAWPGDLFMASSGEAIKAESFMAVADQVGYNINIQKGDICRGQYFLDLEDYVNSKI